MSPYEDSRPPHPPLPAALSGTPKTQTREAATAKLRRSMQHRQSRPPFWNNDHASSRHKRMKAPRQPRRRETAPQTASPEATPQTDTLYSNASARSKSVLQEIPRYARAALAPEPRPY